MKDPLAAKLAELAERFRVRAAAEKGAIALALAAADRVAVTERAHKLAGSAGMFGAAEIGAAALALEEAAEAGADMYEPGERLLALLAAF